MLVARGTAVGLGLVGHLASCKTASAKSSVHGPLTGMGNVPSPAVSIELHLQYLEFDQVSSIESARTCAKSGHGARRDRPS